LTSNKSDIFEELFRSLFGPLCGFAMKYVNDADEAKNIVHEVFISAWEKFDSLASDSNYRGYLYTGVRNRCLNHIRDKKKHVKLDQVPEHDVALYATELENSELEQKIDMAIQSLPEKCRMVFELNRMEGLKYAQIAEKMQISVKTVEAQMSKALAVLRIHLAEFLSIVFFLIVG
jgi:RNA polymerase sigma-70 factor (ECF subfamily)